MDKIKQIGFKAGKKPRRPVIQADTSASKSYASIAYGISEGEIVGLVDGARSIYLDGTPVMSSSGDINIPDVTIQERKGTNDQTYLEGFPAVVNEKQYNNVEMLSSTPFVHYINDTNLDAVGIRFTFGALQRTDPDNGDVSGITIEYAVDVQVDGQGYQELLRTNIVGKYSAGYQRYHRVGLPPADEGWEVRIRRITPNTTSTYIADKMYLDAVAEILDVKMRYPNTALIGLKFDSERFSNIPKVDFRMRGKIIRVPANYDPVARTYAQSGEGTTNGIWNGQFKMAYTTNPAWIFYDLVLNKRYGLGNRIDPSMLDKWSLYSIAQYCDVMVSDGEGGLEPRFTCNVYINNRFEAYDCLMQLAGVFRGIMYWSGTAIIAGCDRPQDPVFTYTRANIIGEFNYSGTRTRDRHSVVMVSFDDPKNNYKTDKEVVSDRKAISEIGVRTKDLAAFACTSRGQAQRAGKWALFKEQLETRIVTFALGMDGYIAPVGRVIEIADPLLAGRAVGGRIAAVSADKKTITLDRDTAVKVGDRLVLNNEEGEQESRQVSSVSGRNVTVTIAFDSPAVQHVWAVDSDDLQLMRFTVISVTENRSQDSINFTVTALQHEPALHEVADYSAYIERNNYSVTDITTQKAPAEVLISSNNRINQGIDITDLVISWKQAENAVKYHVQWRRDDGNWIQMPLQYGNQVTVENVYHGVYEARVVAINAADVNSLPTSSLPTTVNSKFAEPAALASFAAKGILLGVELSWKFPLYGAQNAAFVEIYWALNADKSDEQLLGSYAYPTTGTTLNGLAPHLTLYFRGRLVDRNGIASEFTQWVTATADANPDKLIDIISGHISESTLDQILKGKIDGAGALAGEANSLASQANAAASNAQNAANQATIKAQEAANAAAQEAADRAAAIQDGITQVTTDYRAGDAVVLGELNAYKASNDSAMATVVQKAESAVATGLTNSQAITELTGQVQAINNTKLDASVISNYYTKGQADDKSAEIAAGKIESYDANLVIGGTNLLLNSDFSGDASWSKWGDNGGGYVKVADPTYGAVLQTNLPSGLVHNWVKLENNVEYTYSALVKSSNALYMNGNTPLHYWAGKDNVHQNKIYVLSTSHGRIEAGKWTRISIVFKLVDDADSFRPFIFGLSGLLQLAWTKLERGNKATDWSPNDQEVHQSINANANAIQTTNAEVSRINGEVVATANSVSTLSSNVGLLQGSINEVRQTVTNNQESTNTLVTSLRSGMADADDVSMMMRNATVLHEDLSFKNGWNGVQVYNNYGNGALAANFTDKLPDNPVASTRQIEFIHSGGATTPELGGFHQTVMSRANGVFLVKFVAKLPVGYDFNLAANPYGDGADGYFIGSSEGTGKFKTYHAVYRCGATGSFSSIGFVYANGPQPTPENPLIWYLASSTVYDCLDSKVAPDSVVNGIAEAKSIASTAVNKSEATALIAQNLQASLDSTNANISNNYYTKAQVEDKATTIAAGEVNKYTANLKIGGTNLLAKSKMTNGYVNGATGADGTSAVHLRFKTPETLGSKRTVVFSAAVSGLEFKVYPFVGTNYQGSIMLAPNVPYTFNADVTTFKVEIAGAAGNVENIANYKIQLEYGTIPTDWSPAPEDMASAAALSSLDSKVTNIDGVVTSQASQIVTLESSKSAIENGAIAGNNEYIVDLRDPAYNRDLYYPVLLSGFSTELRQTIRVMSTLNSASVPPWSNHAGGFSLNAQFQMGGAGWGTIDPEIVTDNFSFAFTHGGISPLDQIGQMWTSSQPFFYVRGGGYYKLSKPVSKSVQVCAPGGSLVGYHGETVNPRPYQESTVPKSINQGLNQQNVKLQQTNTVLDGVKAVSTVTVDNNGVMSGYGLISELVNGQVRSSFGVNADTFYIGSPSLDKKPFIQRNDWSVINGVWVPPGTYIDTAFIGAATIGTAHIAELAVKSAQIDNLAVTSGKIANLAVDTLQIKDRAVTAPYILTKAASPKITLEGYNYAPNTYPLTKFVDWGVTGLTPNTYFLVGLDGYVKFSFAGDGFSRVSSATMYVKLGDTYLLNWSFASGERAWSGSPQVGSTNSASMYILKSDANGNVKLEAAFGATTFARYRRVELEASDLKMYALELKK